MDMINMIMEAERTRDQSAISWRPSKDGGGTVVPVQRLETQEKSYS